MVDSQTLKLQQKLRIEKATREKERELKENPAAAAERARKHKEFSALGRFKRGKGAF